MIRLFSTHTPYAVSFQNIVVGRTAQTVALFVQNQNSKQAHAKMLRATFGTTHCFKVVSGCGLVDQRYAGPALDDTDGFTRHLFKPKTKPSVADTLFGSNEPPLRGFRAGDSSTVLTRPLHCNTAFSITPHRNASHHIEPH
jgi:hypothetical protein